MRKLLVILLLSLCFGRVSGQHQVAPRFVQVMQDGMERYESGNTDEALRHFLEVGRHTKGRCIPLERTYYIHSREKMAECYMKQQKAATAFQICQDLMELNLTGEEMQSLAPLYVASGYLVAERNLEEKNFEQVRELVGEIRPFANDSVDGKIGELLSVNSYSEGIYYFRKLHYDRAYACMRTALEGFQEIDDKESQVVVLLQLCYIQLQKENIAVAESHLTKAHELASLLQDDSLMFEVLQKQLNLAQTINNINLCNRTRKEMELLSSGSLDIDVKKVFFQQQGKELLELGEYGLSEYYLTRYKELCEETEDPSNLCFSMSTYNSLMHDVKAAKGDYVAAIDFIRQYITLVQGFYKGPSVYTGYVRMGADYAALGDTAAVRMCIDSINVGIQCPTEEPLETAQLYLLRSFCHRSIGDYEHALSDVLTGDEMLAEDYGQQQYNRMLFLVFKANYLTQLDRYEEAVTCYEKHAAITKLQYGRHSKMYSDLLYYWANAEILRENFDKGAELYQESVDILKRLIQEQLRYVTPLEREDYWATISSRMWAMSGFALEGGHVSDDFTMDCYNALLFSKALLLESDKSMYDVLKEHASESGLQQFVELSMLQANLRELERDFETNQNTIACLHTKAKNLDYRLGEQLQSYKSYIGFLDFDYEDVRNSLQKHEVLVDFTDFELKQQHQYVAYVVRKEYSRPVLVKTFVGQHVDSLLAGRPVDVLYSDVRASSLFWDCLRSYVDEGDTVYYIPSGVMYQIALESLVLEDGSLLGDHYHFARLSSAREKVAYHTALGPSHTAALYGGLQYDVDPMIMLAESKKFDGGSLLAMRGSMRGDGTFVSLPETKVEIQQIAQVLKSDFFDVVSYTDEFGTEESFLSLDGCAPQILHLATHGFFYSPNEAVVYDYLKGYKDAMSLSGLVLSGGNAAWKGEELPSGVLSGILTAQNISGLDLSGTELVVLSACQTGLGKVTSEGLFGLQRAFKKAKAGTLVLSLWKVDDLITRKLMVEFYKNLSRSKGDKRASLERAKQTIRKSYPEPFYWAGFVMVD